MSYDGMHTMHTQRDFKQRQLGGVGNYGSAGNLESPGSPASSSSDHNINNNHPSHLVEKKSSVFCLHGQRKIEVYSVGPKGDPILVLKLHELILNFQWFKKSKTTEDIYRSLLNAMDNLARALPVQIHQTDYLV
uniref:Uncharacterized protein n=1 Tax=Glossina palpalis gambiensis TaxID=67801 RepID=A0A1B0BDE8_9MUSC